MDHISATTTLYNILLQFPDVTNIRATNPFTSHNKNEYLNLKTTHHVHHIVPACWYYKYIMGALKWSHCALLNYFEALNASSAVSAPELCFTIFRGLYNKLRDEFQNSLKSIMRFCLKFWPVQISIYHNSETNIDN